MISYALVFLLGILISFSQYEPYFTIILWALSPIVLIIWYGAKYQQEYYTKFGLLILTLIAGLLWGYLNGHHLLQSRLNTNQLNKQIVIKGAISDIINVTQQKTSFIFNTEHPFIATLKLAWYQQPTPLKVGDVWQLNVKLKANNGLQNEVGFDYETSLFIKNIDATGYVRSRKLIAPNQYLRTNNQFLLNQFKDWASHQLLPLLLPLDNGGILYALISGKRTHLSAKQWQRFINTNTSHLTVVSGLHIGLISGMMFLLALVLYRRCYRCCLKLPAPIFSAYVGILSALAYAGFSGFSISTTRAFIMAGAVFLAIIMRKNMGIWQLYSYALLLVLLLNPLSVLKIGFWLSFFAVAIIIYGAKHYQNKSKLWRLVFIQLLISLSMLPLLFWFFNAGNIASFLANIIAVPIVSFFTLPLSLLGAIFVFIQLDFVAKLLFYLGDVSLIFLHWFLDIVWQWTHFFWLNYPITSLGQFVLLLLGFAILFLPKGLKLRGLGLVIVLVLLTNPSSHSLKTGQFQLVVFDSGQGLASLIKTKNHTMIFDTGFASRSSKNGFNIGQAVLVPYLKKYQLDKLDKVIISHSDNDHIGGFAYLKNNSTMTEILSSEPKKIPQSTACQFGQSWQYDLVTFTILNPNKTRYRKGNNNSCVLKIDNGTISALLTGDIEKKAEKQLINLPNIQSTILVVPHHGSKTSSTDAFLTAVSPSIAINSSGFSNRFGHPHPKVKQRYQQRHIDFYDTQCSGQISLLIGASITISQYRKDNARYWIRQCK